MLERNQLDVSAVWEEASKAEQRESEALIYPPPDGEDESVTGVKVADLSELVRLAETGTVDAAVSLLWFVQMRLTDDSLVLPPALREWFSRVVNSIEDDPSQATSAVLTKPGPGRKPANATVRSAFEHAHMKRTACRTVRALVSGGLSQLDACLEVAETMKERGIVDARKGTPYTLSTVQRWCSDGDRSPADPS